MNIKIRNCLVFVIAALLHAAAIIFLVNIYKSEVKEELVMSFDATTTEEIDTQAHDEEISQASTPMQKQENIIEEKVEKAEVISKVEEKIIEKTVDSINSVAMEEKKQIIAKDRSVIFNASYLKNPQPVYPRLSRKLREEGLTIIYAYVEKDGKVSSLSIKSSSGYERLDNAALQAVKNWSFLPAKKNSVLIASLVEIPINFKLEK